MTILIFDTETASLNGDIIQAAYLETEILNGKVICISSQGMHYKPGENIDFEAMAVHHIIPEDLKDCPPHTSCNIPAETQYIIGHNIDYDMNALKKAGQNRRDVKRICTLAIMRYLYPELRSHKLSVLCYRFSEDLNETQQLLRHSHNALADCYATKLLVEHIMKVQDIQSIEELYQLSEKARYPLHFHWGRHRGQKISALRNSELRQALKYEKDSYLILSIETELDSRKVRCTTH